MSKQTIIEYQNRVAQLVDSAMFASRKSELNYLKKEAKAVVKAAVKQAKSLLLNPPKKSPKRISFSEHNAAHLYELALEHFIANSPGECYSCVDIKSRLEKFIGKKEVARIKKSVKKNPYKS
jgi:hypothetical protein